MPRTHPTTGPRAFLGGILLTTAIAATAGVQSATPYETYTGYGWKTDATAASQAVTAATRLVPQQGTNEPGGYLETTWTVNGGTAYRGALLQITRPDGTTTTGWGNTTYGHQAGNALTLTDATNNTMIGAEAGKKTTNGDQNTYIGSRAGNENLTGEQNTGIGQGSLYQGSTIGYSVGVGFHSGKNATGGEGVYLGWSAGEGASAGTATGVGNVFVGWTSGAVYTTGAQNACVGRYSGRVISTGSFSALLGASSGFSLTTGGEHVLIGYQAGYTATGANAITTGTKCVFVGYQSGPGNTSAGAYTNQIGIGHGVTVLRSNACRIGNDTVREFGFGCEPPAGGLGISTTNTVTTAAIAQAHWYPITFNGVAYKLLLGT